MSFRNTLILLIVIPLFLSFPGKGFALNARDYTTDSIFIFDDGTAETGWNINSGFTAWLGNYFPISLSYSGVLVSFDVYFITNVNGSTQQLSIDVFDNSFQLTGSSSTFNAIAGSWISVPASDIPISGPFYAMVKWTNLPRVTHYLGLDTDGPYASQDLERFYNGTSFQKLSDPAVAGSPKAVFLLRAHAKLNPFGIPEINNDATVIVFPLPAENYLDIIATRDMTEVKMFDLSGRTCLNMSSVNQERLHLDLSGFPEGIYVLSVGTKSGTTVKKIAILRR